MKRYIFLIFMLILISGCVSQQISAMDKTIPVCNKNSIRHVEVGFSEENNIPAYKHLFELKGWNNITVIAGYDGPWEYYMTGNCNQ